MSFDLSRIPWKSLSWFVISDCAASYWTVLKLLKFSRKRSKKRIGQITPSIFMYIILGVINWSSYVSAAFNKLQCDWSFYSNLVMLLQSPLASAQRSRVHMWRVIMFALLSYLVKGRFGACEVLSVYYCSFAIIFDDPIFSSSRQGLKAERKKREEDNRHWKTSQVCSLVTCRVWTGFKTCITNKKNSDLPLPPAKNRKTTWSEVLWAATPAMKKELFAVAHWESKM